MTIRKYHPPLHRTTVVTSLHFHKQDGQDVTQLEAQQPECARFPLRNWLFSAYPVGAPGVRAGFK